MECYSCWRKFPHNLKIMDHLICNGYGVSLQTKVRDIGNAFIYDYDISITGLLYYKIVTDFGNTLQLTESELEDTFYTTGKIFICKRKQRFKDQLTLLKNFLESINHPGRNTY